MIEARNLTKVYRIARPKEGRFAAVRALFHSEYTEKRAVERAAAWGMILTIVPSAALLWVLNKSEMYFLDLRPGVLAMNLGCAALLALSYILPVRLALKKAMRGIRAEER